jgi:hypothetical protein
MPRLIDLGEEIQGLLVEFVKFGSDRTRGGANHRSEHAVGDIVRTRTHQDVICLHACSPRRLIGIAPGVRLFEIGVG